MKRTTLQSVLEHPYAFCVGEPVTYVQAPKAKGHRSRALSAFQLPDLGLRGGLRGRTADILFSPTNHREVKFGMKRCDEMVGKVVQAFSLCEDGPYGPEINVEFTDGTTFNCVLRNSLSLEAKLLRTGSGHSETVQDFSAPVDR